MSKINDVLNYLTERNYDVSIETVIKNGVEVEGIKFNMGTICPINYMPADEDEYTVEEIAERFIKQSEQQPDFKFDVNDITDYSKSKEIMYPCLGSSAATAHCVRRHICGDYYEYVRIFLTDEANTCVTPELLDALGISENELFGNALANAIANERFIAKDFLGMLDMVCSRTGIFGAAAILDRALLDNICDKRDTDTIQFIPSSIHEMIIAPMPMTGEDIRNMAADVNSSVVDPRDILGVDGIEYNRRTGKLAIIE